jgi:hypothetical protein
MPKLEENTYDTVKVGSSSSSSSEEESDEDKPKEEETKQSIEEETAATTTAQKGRSLQYEIADGLEEIEGDDQNNAKSPT